MHRNPKLIEVESLCHNLFTPHHLISRFIVEGANGKCILDNRKHLFELRTKRHSFVKYPTLPLATNSFRAMQHTNPTVYFTKVSIGGYVL